MMVTYKDLAFEVRFSDKRRTVGITVERDGSLVLRAPQGATREQIEKVVYKKRMWVYRTLAKKELLNPPTVRKEFVSGEGFYYLGRSYRLKLVSDNDYAPLRLYQSRLELHRSEQQKGRELLIAWYKEHLKPRVRDEVAAFADRIGAHPRSAQVRDLGYRWGSCGTKGDLYLHWRAAMLPKALIRYVIVHELVHLLEPHHGRAFWERVERAMPDYRVHKDRLEREGRHFDL